MASHWPVSLPRKGIEWYPTLGVETTESYTLSCLSVMSNYRESRFWTHHLQRARSLHGWWMGTIQRLELGQFWRFQWLVPLIKLIAALTTIVWNLSVLSFPFSPECFPILSYNYKRNRQNLVSPQTSKRKGTKNFSQKDYLNKELGKNLTNIIESRTVSSIWKKINEEESLSIYPYTYKQMWFQGSVDCPSPAARGGETHSVPAWAPISQLFPLFRSETLKWSVESTFCSSHRPSLSDRLDGSTPEKGW